MRKPGRLVRVSATVSRRIFFVILSFFGGLSTLRAQTASGPHSDWSDLESQESRVYGSEKEKKFPINALIVEKEEWEGHYAFHLFWLYRNTDYPRYRSRAVLPFYYHLESKIDNRERTISFPFYLSQTDADTTFSLTPLTLFDDSASNWFHFYGWLFLRRGDKTFTHTALLPVVYFGSDDKSQYSAVLPFYYYNTETSGQSASRFLITPLFYASGSESLTSSNSFSISPLHFHSFQNEIASPSKKDQAGQRRQDSGYLGFPVLPILYYSSWADNKTQHRVLTILDWERSDDGLSEFDLYPLIFYGANHLVAAPFYFRFGKEDDRLTFGPIYYLADDARTSDRLIGPVWWSNRKDKSAGSLHVFPAYFSWTDSDSGSVSNSFSISPLHIQSTEGSNSGFAGFPVIPFLYYTSWNGNYTHHKVLSLFDWESSDSSVSDFYFFPLVFYGKEHLIVNPFYFRFGTETDRLTFGPIYYLSDDARTSDRLIGPVWWSNRKDGKSNSLHVFPLYFSWREFEAGSESSSFSISPLHIQSSGKEAVYVKTEKGSGTAKMVDSGFAGFPILPFLYYSSWKGSESHRKILTLLDWTASEQGVSQFYFFPFVFYGGDYLTVAPFYFRFGKETDRTSFGPIYYFSEDANSSESLVGPVWWSNRKDGKAESLHVAPFFFSWSEKTASASDVTRLSPGLFYWNRTGRSEHLNVLGLLDLGFDESGLNRTWALPLVFSGEEYRHVLPFYFSTWTLNDKKEVTESYKLGPVYYWHNSPSGRERLVGPVFWSSNVDNTQSTFYVLPVSFYWSKKKDLERSSFALNPLFFQLANYAGEKENLAFYDLFWAPLIPLYFSNQTETASRRHLLLANWSNDVTGLRQLWIMPFYFWRDGKASGYLHVPPFFFRPSGSKVAEGYSFGPLHYHSWSTAHEKLWLLLLYRDIEVEAQYFHVLPFFYSWHTQESTGQLALPLWFQYEDKTKAYSFNIAGVSRSRVAGVVDTDVGSKAGRWYLDTEVSWLYNAFSLSARVSTPEKEKQKDPTLQDLKDPGIRDIAEAEQQKQLDLAVPRLSKKLTVSRDDTFYYWGFSVLYGVLSYQHADTRRHFRLLPFAWLSWDERSDDKVTVVPGAFLNYHSEDTEYFALFPAFIPIYGKQRIGNSYVKAYGVFLGIDEYDDETKQKELSILWPFANFYSSPNQEGSRVIPFYWNRLTRTGDQVNKRTISLVHYRSSTESPGVQESFWAVPLVVPLFLRTDTMQGTREAMWSTLIPFFYYSSSSDSSTGQSRMTLFSLPGIYHNRESTEKDGKRSSNSTTFVMGYYSSESPDESTTSLLGLYKSEQRPESSYRHLLWGLAASDHTGKESRQWIIPFYYSRDTQEGSGTSSWFFLTLPFVYLTTGTTGATAQYHTNVMFLADWQSNQDGLKRFWFLPLFAWSGDEDGYFYLFPYYSGRSADGETSTYLPPVYYSSSSPKESTTFAAGLYLHSSENESRQNFLYLYDHQREANDNSYQALLGAFQYSTSPSSTRFNLLYHLLASYRSQTSESNSESDLDYIFFLGGVETRKDYSHHRVLPFYWYESTAESTFFLSPLVYYNGDRSIDKQTESWTALIAGLYLHASEKESRQNFLYLLDHSRENERHSYGALLGAVDYTSEPNVSRFNVLYGLLVNYRSQLADAKSNLDLAFLFYLGAVKSGDNNTHHRLLPFYMYSDSPLNTFFASPLLYYNSDHPGENKPSSWTAFAAGLYLHSSPDYERQDFLLLYDHKRDFDTDYYQGLLGLVGFETRKEYLHHRLLPVYWYESTPQSTFLVSPILYYNNDRSKDEFRADIPIAIPFVWHYSQTGQDISQCALACTAWFNRFDSQERSARAMLLAGLLYNDVQRPERGYRSRGSVWGLLWDYETETNGFSKISVLKFVFSRTTDESGTRTRILGFSI
ncbi:MAG: hypothetical protein K8S54_17525 [Spirochaetia bacterium]|nr:hypothetical protein [Spirochaetia bacterium]